MWVKDHPLLEGVVSLGSRPGLCVKCPLPAASTLPGWVVWLGVVTGDFGAGFLSGAMEGSPWAGWAQQPPNGLAH